MRDLQCVIYDVQSMMREYSIQNNQYQHPTLNRTQSLTLTNLKFKRVTP